MAIAVPYGIAGDLGKTFSKAARVRLGVFPSVTLNLLPTETASGGDRTGGVAGISARDAAGALTSVDVSATYPERLNAVRYVSTPGAVESGGVTTLDVSALPGISYTAALDAWRIGVSPSAVLAIVFRNEAGAVLATTKSASAALGTAPGRIAVTGLAPAATSQVRLELRNSTAAGSALTWYMDNLQIERGTVASAWTRGAVTGVSDSWYLVEASDDGTTYTTLRFGAKLRADVNGRIEVYDYEAPPGRIRMYRARTVAVIEGELITSPPSEPTYALMRLKQVWVKNPLDPSRNFTVPVDTKWQEIDVARDRKVVHLLGRALPLVLRSDTRGDSFSLTWTIIGDHQFDLIRWLIDSSDTLLIQTPRRQWFVQMADDPKIREDMFSVSEEPARQATIPFVEVSSV